MNDSLAHGEAPCKMHVSVPGARCACLMPAYRGARRQRSTCWNSLRLCGWAADKRRGSDEALRAIHANGQHAASCAVAKSTERRSDVAAKEEWDAIFRQCCARASRYGGSTRTAAYVWENSWIRTALVRSASTLSVLWAQSVRSLRGGSASRTARNMGGKGQGFWHTTLVAHVRRAAGTRCPLAASVLPALASCDPTETLTD